jgi:hypothetical protein
MTRARTRRPKPKATSGNDKRDRLERALEEGLRESFPASDAVAVTEPAPTAPGEDEIRADRISPPDVLHLPDGKPKGVA